MSRFTITDAEYDALMIHKFGDLPDFVEVCEEETRATIGSVGFTATKVDAWRLKGMTQIARELLYALDGGNVHEETLEAIRATVAAEIQRLKHSA